MLPQAACGIRSFVFSPVLVDIVDFGPLAAFGRVSGLLPLHRLITRVFSEQRRDRPGYVKAVRSSENREWRSLRARLERPEKRMRTGRHSGSGGLATCGSLICIAWLTLHTPAALAASGITVHLESVTGAAWSADGIELRILPGDGSGDVAASLHVE